MIISVRVILYSFNCIEVGRSKDAALRVLAKVMPASEPGADTGCESFLARSPTTRAVA